MAFDAHKNLAIATVTNSPGTAGTSITVAGGEGARFPAVPFNATVWPATELPTPVSAEVVRVTARTTDTLTITRAQEGTTARAIVAGDLFAATITAKNFTDIESGVNFPQLGTAGDLAFTTPGVHVIRTNSADGADADIIQVTASGAGGGTRGAYLNLFGNEYPGSGGAITMEAGNGNLGVIDIASGGAVRGRVHKSGGFSWGSTTDPGAANLSVNGFVQSGALTQLTNPGADTSALTLCGGGNAAPSRGGTIYLQGNNSASGQLGTVQLCSGAVASGRIEFFTGPSTAKVGTIHASGGFSWGGTTDPGAGNFLVSAAGATAGSGHVLLTIGGAIQCGIAATAGAAMYFYTASGQAGSISLNGLATAYNTSSDARLKTDRGRHTDPEVLRRTVIHNFIWQSDGTPGRGVFAQEAQVVAPFAVSVGTDEVDAEGRLTKPWGVDYSKYVPDLITGWQAHDERLAGAFDRINALELLVVQTRMDALRRDVGTPIRPWVHRVITWARRLFPAWITP